VSLSRGVVNVDKTETPNSTVAVSDKELVDKLRNREPTAVVELCNAYFDRIYRLVFSQVDGDRDVAQDIAQETFLAAFKSAHRFRGQSKVYTWLYSIANRKVADFYRRRKREGKHRADPLESQVYEAETDGTAESEETSKSIQQVLSCLPLHYKQVLLLKYVEEMPVADICQVMERSAKSVEGLLTRARRELRSELAAQKPK
jgi:RNA polymerase sigma factor (sigma-70 family)